VRSVALFASGLALVVAFALGLTASAYGAGTFYIRGGGYGHGIGMSQYGAYGYARHGKSYGFILRHYYQGTRIGHTDPNQIVRVLLKTGESSFAGATRAAGKALNPSLTYSVRPLADGAVALYNAKGKKLAAAQPPLVATGPGPLAVAGLGTYHGSLEFRPDGAGGVETIDALGLDNYVRGVVASEIPSTWAPAALKAQAVAARTYAITTNVDGAGFDLYPDTRSQMYGGVGAETAATDAAVAATRGRIVTYDGNPAVTYFFSSSGGYTEDIQNVWPGSAPEPWLRGVPDPYDGAGGNPYHHWGFELSAAAAASKLGTLVEGSLVGIAVTRTGVSPRILAARVLGTRGTVPVTGVELQHVFGLQTTLAKFTTITTVARFGPPPSGTAASRTAGKPAGARAVAALVPLVKAAVAGTTPRLAGVVFPASRPRSVHVQRSAHGHWRTIKSRLSLGSGGSYSIVVPAPGTYRIVAGGLDGPSVKLG
jgi:stage II sporulation protein D